MDSVEWADLSNASYQNPVQSNPIIRTELRSTCAAKITGLFAWSLGERPKVHQQRAKDGIPNILAKGFNISMQVPSKATCNIGCTPSFGSGWDINRGVCKNSAPELELDGHLGFRVGSRGSRGKPTKVARQLGGRRLDRNSRWNHSVKTRSLLSIPHYLWSFP